MKKVVFLIACVFLLNACNEDKKEVKSGEKPEKQTKESVVLVPAPSFNADSAYKFIKEQVDFGLRVPNTQQHKACAEYLKNKLSGYGLELLIQEAQVTAFNGAKLNIQNIMGRFHPERNERIFLFAHWDTRPFADRDTKNQNKPILGANDGASGVGVLLEIARLISITDPGVGIDIMFFDAEDYGAIDGGQFMDVAQMNDTWCLGSQYWAKNMNIPNYRPRYGILLDMVGAKDAVFPKEGISMQFAPNLVNKIWNLAEELGYGNYFIKRLGSSITDDHTYINYLTGIPSIDIIHYDPDRRDFGKFHHTHDDNMDIIDKNTLKAVGQVLTEVIYRRL
jgi:hypothetical protein